MLEAGSALAFALPPRVPRRYCWRLLRPPRPLVGSMRTPCWLPPSPNSSRAPVLSPRRQLATISIIVSSSAGHRCCGRREPQPRGKLAPATARPAMDARPLPRAAAAVITKATSARKPEPQGPRPDELLTAVATTRCSRNNRKQGSRTPKLVARRSLPNWRYQQRCLLLWKDHYRQNDG